MKNLVITLCYDGTDFHGWQYQPGLRTVQGELQLALQKLLGNNYSLKTSSRTDAGVHALRHPVGIRVQHAIPASGLRKALNSRLPSDMKVVDSVEVDPLFDVKKHATGKTYCYRIITAMDRIPLESRYAWIIHEHLNIEKMKQAAKLMLGEHDFSAFRAANCDASSSVREVQAVCLYPTTRGIDVYVRANAFLKNMVRIIIGTLVQVGLGRKEPTWVSDVIKSKKRSMAGPTSPARGLTLVQVHYPPELFWGHCNV